MDPYGPSRHYTMVFNTFVVMQIFNFFNARTLEDEVNIFEGLSDSPLFCIIVLIITVGQLIIGSFGGRVFRVSFNAMDPRQWLIACGFGFGCWVVAYVFKVLTPSSLKQYNVKGNADISVKNANSHTSTKRIRAPDDQENALMRNDNILNDILNQESEKSKAQQTANRLGSQMAYG